MALSPLAHGDGCSCWRCRGFRPGEPGPAERHGCYSLIRLQPRADALRADLEPLIPLATPADGPALDLLALTLAQTERAAIFLADAQAVAELPPERLDRLSADARGWTNAAARLLDQLGMTPTARAKLAGDLAAAGRDAGLARLAAEGRAIRERREAGNVGARVPRSERREVGGA